MKQLMIFLSILFVITAGCSVLSGRNEPAGELFEGTSQGHRGPITVQVRVYNGSITEIIVAESEEDRNVGGAAIEELIGAVIDNNSADVDVISGATITSKGFLSAINAALSLSNK